VFQGRQLVHELLLGVDVVPGRVTSAPAARSSETSLAVRPKPPAAFRIEDGDVASTSFFSGAGWL